MRMPTVGWAYFGLVVVLVAGYLLNCGVYVGSSIVTDGTYAADGATAYKKVCTYLYLNGTRIEEGFISKTPKGADFFCSPLHP
jgi:hypothetical protein